MELATREKSTAFFAQRNKGVWSSFAASIQVRLAAYGNLTRVVDRPTAVY
jgi:hypothetical protein